MTEVKLWTVGEVAKKLHLSTQTVRNRAACLSSPAMRLGKQRERVFTDSQIKEISEMKQESSR